MILLTRQKIESQKMAATLEAKGLKTIIEPMLKIHYQPPDLQKIFGRKIQAFIVTSKNARKFAPPGSALISIPEHGDNAHELLGYALTNLIQSGGKVIYLRGRDITYDLTTELQQLRFDAEEIIVYSAEAPETFTSEFLKNLPKIKLATFFSANTYRNFISLAEKANLINKLSGIDALFIGKKLLEQEIQLKWKKTYAASAPNLESMLEQIEILSKRHAC